MKNVNTEERNFYITQIETTKKIINQFSDSKEFSPTMLINSLLSLVVLPFEKVKVNNREKLFPGKYTVIIQTLGITPKVFTPIGGCNGRDIKYNNRTIYEFIRKLRNGIAHQNLIVQVDANREVHITIYNIYKRRMCQNCKNKICSQKGLQHRSNGTEDFRIEVTVSQLQKLAIYIANAYLKKMKTDE